MSLLTVVYTAAIAVVLSLSVPLAKLGKLLWKLWRIGRKVDLIPGPERDLIVGNILQIPSNTEKLLAWFTSNCIKYKTAYSFWTGPFMPRVIVCHPSTVKILMSSYEPKPLTCIGTYTLMAEIIGQGMLLSSGEAWLRKRRLITKAFHFDILKRYAIIKNEAADILLEKFEAACDMEGLQGRSVDITPHVSLCTFNVILRCAFSNEDDVQHQGLEHPFLTASVRQLQLLNMRASNALYHVGVIYNMTAHGKEWRECSRIGEEFVWNIIEKRKNELNEVQSDGNSIKGARDFLDILMLARDEDGLGFTDLELQHEVNTFLAAGFDTSSSTISWCLYNLSCHPVYQSKARDEVDALLDGKESGDILWGDLNGLPYLTMCIKESMRLFPTVPFISRGIKHHMEIDGVTLEPETQVIGSIWDVHHNPDVWGDDHMEYKPDRFSPENVSRLDPHAFVPFSAGPRNCIGQHFAMNQVKIVIAKILSRFILKMDPDKKPEFSIGLVLRAKNGIHIYLKKR